MHPLDENNWHHIIRPGSRVYIGSNAACPHGLIRSMLANYQKLVDIELVHILTLGPTPWIEPPYNKTFQVNSFFLGPGIRDVVNDGLGDYTPASLSDIPSIFNDKVLPLDVALIQVSPPDESGNCSLGVSVDISLAACRAARVIVAQINPSMPRTFGRTTIHCDEIDYVLEIDEPLIELRLPPPDSVTERIGRNVANLIEDGSTLQLGIGRIPNAICRYLTDHRHLGIHTETFSDGVVDLMQAGVIDNSRKTLNPGKTIAAFAMGTAEFYRALHLNKDIELHPTEYTNHPMTIAAHDYMVSINSALQVDITGQVASDTLGARFYSGIGGNVDFMRGAALSNGGLAIVALPSTAKGGSVSRIVPQLYEAAGVVATRADVHFVVTEFGIATLRGRSIRERVLELIGVTHPHFREDLLREARKRKLIPESLNVPLETDEAIAGVAFQRVTLRNEPFVIRPLMPSDERRLQEFFYSHDEDTIKSRYGHVITRMSRERARQLVGVDQTRDLALGIYEVKGPRQLIHAVGRYYLDDSGNSGEMAFVVRESMRRHGMGTQLLLRMLEVARQRHLQSLWAIVARPNMPMAKLFLKHGARRVPYDDSAYAKFEFPLQTTAPE